LLRDSEFNDLVKYTTGESRRIEVKGSISWDDERSKLKITKSILALTNIKDGGLLILGVNQDVNKLSWVGMQEEHLKSYNYDEVSSHVARYADPHAQFSLTRSSYESKTFIVITVNEFDQVPVLCKRDHNMQGLSGLKAGKFYTRTRRIPESAEVSTLEDLREIVELATDKAVTKFLGRAATAGLLRTTPSIEKFDGEMNAFFSEEGNLLSKLKLKGYWIVIVRPPEFKRERLRLLSCEDVVIKSIVKFREYNYPHYYVGTFQEGRLVRGGYFVRWSNDILPRRMFVEPPFSIWQMTQSGQFIHFFALLEDYWKSTISKNVLTFTNLVWSITEIYKFLSNLALKNTFDGEASLKIELHNTKGRRLIEGKDSLQIGYEYAVESLDRHRSFTESEIVAKSLDFALDDVSRMLEHIGIDSSSQFWRSKLSEEQQRVLDPKLRGFPGF
jgi:Putative DNA-binding domain